MKDRHRWLAVILGLALVRGLLYAAIVPPWQAPDETGHFEYAWLLARLGHIPHREDISSGFERELLGSLYEWRYGDFIGRPLPEIMPERMDDLSKQIFARRSRLVLTERFSLAYLWAALFIWPLQHQDLALQLYAARLASVVLNLIIIWLAWKTFETLLPRNHRLVAAMTAVVLFLPQHTFINSTVGDGTLAEVMACLVIYSWARVFSREVDGWGIAGVVVGTVTGIWTKRTAAFLLPLDIFLIGWWLFRQSFCRRTKQHRAGLLIAFVVLILLGGLVFYSPFGTWVKVALTDWSKSSLLLVDEKGSTLADALLLSFDSFWANFGWMAVPLSFRWYGAIAFLTAAAILGWGIKQKGRIRSSWGLGLMGGAFSIALAIFVCVALLGKGSSGYYQYQGRYLFSAIIPFAFIFVGGWERLLSAGGKEKLVAVTLILFTFFDFWCIMLYLIPYFYLS